MDDTQYSDGAVVWVKLAGGKWWPGQVVAKDTCPDDLLKGRKKDPVAIVKFFEEDCLEVVKSPHHIYPFLCPRKEEFIRKGQEMSRLTADMWAGKFSVDVAKAERLSGSSGVPPTTPTEDAGDEIKEDKDNDTLNSKMVANDDFAAGANPVADENGLTSGESTNSNHVSSTPNHKDTFNSSYAISPTQSDDTSALSQTQSIWKFSLTENGDKDEEKIENLNVRIRLQPLAPPSEPRGRSCIHCSYQTQRMSNLLRHYKDHYRSGGALDGYSHLRLFSTGSSVKRKAEKAAKKAAAKVAKVPRKKAATPGGDSERKKKENAGQTPRGRKRKVQAVTADDGEGGTPSDVAVDGGGSTPTVTKKPKKKPEESAFDQIRRGTVIPRANRRHRFLRGMAGDDRPHGSDSSDEEFLITRAVFGESSDSEEDEEEQMEVDTAEDSQDSKTKVTDSDVEEVKDGKEKDATDDGTRKEEVVKVVGLDKEEADNAVMAEATRILKEKAPEVPKWPEGSEEADVADKVAENVDDTPIPEIPKDDKVDDNKDNSICEVPNSVAPKEPEPVPTEVTETSTSEVSKVIDPSPEVSQIIEPSPEVSKIVEPSPEVSKIVEPPSPEVSKIIEPSSEVSQMIEPSTPEVSQMIEPSTPEVSAIEPSTLEVLKVTEPSAPEVSKITEPSATDIVETISVPDVRKQSAAEVLEPSTEEIPLPAEIPEPIDSGIPEISTLKEAEKIPEPFDIPEIPVINVEDIPLPPMPQDPVPKAAEYLPLTTDTPSDVIAEKKPENEEQPTDPIPPLPIVVDSEVGEKVESGNLAKVAEVEDIVKPAEDDVMEITAEPLETKMPDVVEEQPLAIDEEVVQIVETKVDTPDDWRMVTVRDNVAAEEEVDVVESVEETVTLVEEVPAVGRGRGRGRGRGTGSLRGGRLGPRGRMDVPKGVEKEKPKPEATKKGPRAEPKKVQFITDKADKPEVPKQLETVIDIPSPRGGRGPLRVYTPRPKAVREKERAEAEELKAKAAAEERLKSEEAAATLAAVGTTKATEEEVLLEVVTAAEEEAAVTSKAKASASVVSVSKTSTDVFADINPKTQVFQVVTVPAKKVVHQQPATEIKTIIELTPVAPVAAVEMSSLQGMDMPCQVLTIEEMVESGGEIMQVATEQVIETHMDDDIFCNEVVIDSEDKTSQEGDDIEDMCLDGQRAEAAPTKLSAEPKIVPAASGSDKEVGAGKDKDEGKEKTVMVTGGLGDHVALFAGDSTGGQGAAGKEELKSTDLASVEIVDMQAINNKTPECSDSEEEVKLLFSPNDAKDFTAGKIVWVRYRKLYWPALVRRVYPHQKYAMVVFVDQPVNEKGQENKLKISYDRIMRFNCTRKNEFLNVAGPPKLKSAIDLAENYLLKICDSTLYVSPIEYFRNPTSNLLRKLQMESGDVIEDTLPSVSAEVLDKTIAEDVVELQKSDDSEDEDAEHCSVQNTEEENDDEELVGKIIAIVKSDDCKNHLVDTQAKKIECNRHYLYENPTRFNRARLQWPLFGPIKNKAQRDDVCKYLTSVAESIKISDNRVTKFNYVFKVWIAEAVIYALRTIFSVDYQSADDMLRQMDLPKECRKVNE